MSIAFSTNYRKILEAIIYILHKHHLVAKSIFILKCLYYADKYHLQKYASPITGDAFVKLKHGPCATSAYNILQKNELYIPYEILSEVEKSIKVFNKRGAGDRHTSYKALREPNTSVFSESNVECLDDAIDFCSSFKDNYTLSIESHKELAWKNVDYREVMSYEDMIDTDTENREEIIEYLQEYSRSLCL